MDTLQCRAKALRKDPTIAEKKLWALIRKKHLKGHKFRRQAPVAGFIVDFICFEAKLIIELDGQDHINKKRSDSHRTEHLESMGYRILRFWNYEVFKQTNRVTEEILSNLH